MMQLLGSGGAMRLLAAICVVLGAVVAWERAPDTAAVTAAGGGGPAIAEVEVKPAAPKPMPPLANFAEIVERPLFNELRKPRDPDTEIVVAPATVTKTLDAQLVGVFIKPNEEPVALVLLTDTKEYVRVSKGQILVGREVIAVLPDRVVLAGDAPNELKLADAEAQGQGDAGAKRPVPVDPRQRQRRVVPPTPQR